MGASAKQFSFWKHALDPGFSVSHGKRVDFTPEAYQRLARGARSVTPGLAAKTIPTPEGWQSWLQPLRG